jgi:hypothetical protein
MAESADHIPLQTMSSTPAILAQAGPDADHEEFHAYPESGIQAWMVVLGAWCAMVPPLGLVNSMGALHAWIGQNQLENYSESAVGWIFSIHAFFLYIGSSQLGTVSCCRRD